LDLSHILNHLGEDRDKYFGSVSPPIIQSSNFAFSSLNEFRASMGNQIETHMYTRGNNPTVQILRQKLAALESAEDCLVFSSGSGAIANAVISQVQQGDHIVCVKSAYSWTNNLLNDFLPRFGVHTTYVDGRDLVAMEAAIQENTKVLFLESPTSMLMELQDLAACAKIAKKHKLISIIDNSYASPLYQRPIEFGIDIVTHSGTKYINGHSDIVCGVICSSHKIINQIFPKEYMTLGGIIAPHDAAQVIRGLRTLPLRMKQSDESTQKICAFLADHPTVEHIYYPHHPSFPQYELAKKQMSGCGGLFAVKFKTESQEEMEAFFHKLQRFLLAVSWGGHESLVLPAIALYDIPGQKNPDMPIGFVRFYIGLEEPDALISDLKLALTEISEATI